MHRWLYLYCAECRASFLKVYQRRSLINIYYQYNSVMVPATIIKSAWRGENRTTSAPKRAISYFGPTTAMAVVGPISRKNSFSPPAADDRGRHHHHIDESAVDINLQEFSVGIRRNIKYSFQRRICLVTYHDISYKANTPLKTMRRINIAPKVEGSSRHSLNKSNYQYNSVMVPATIIKSAWRGENRTTSAPKRAISYFGPTTAMAVVGPMIISHALVVRFSRQAD